MAAAMDAEKLLCEISSYCRAVGMAESTFGRRAVNDGKFVNRLRYGGRVTLTTVERVRNFIAAGPAFTASHSRMPGPLLPHEPDISAPAQNFRFFDNRQKYLMFVNTCSEKRVVAGRVELELKAIRPRPPAIRLFDAGVGEGTILARTLRAMHRRFPRVPFYVVGKEISLEDTRLTLEKLPGRFQEHPASVVILTNLNYTEAPWLAPRRPEAVLGLTWHEVALRGSTADEFDEQITDLNSFLAAHWRVKIAESGIPVYEKPAVLVLYREDCRFLLDGVLPRRGSVRADYDLVIASQPYRARAPLDFKAKKVIAPLVRSLAPGGRLIGIHSSGGDPGLEIVQRIWPGENPFRVSRHEILRATRFELGKSARLFSFKSYADAQAVFRYDMHTLPNEFGAEAIGTSTLFAAWNAATFVAQIEDDRLREAMTCDDYLKATRDVLSERSGLWFYDESYAISRKVELT